jgi:Stress responsive A/B Barrel Domain
MIVHCVSIKWGEAAGEEQVANFTAALDAIAQLPVVESLVRGPNLGFNPKTAATCDYGFVVHLADAEAMRSYLDHPQHQALGELLAPLVTSLTSLQLEAPNEASPAT